MMMKSGAILFLSLIGRTNALLPVPQSRVQRTMQTSLDANSLRGNNFDESRRSIFIQLACSIGVASTASETIKQKANAVGMPDFGALTSGNNKRKVGGLSNKIRSICRVLDELQRDLMQERWDLVETYPTQLRSYVPVLTMYTDSAFPTDAPTDKGLRVALRYEVGRFFAALERLRQATGRQALDEAFVAYADMSLHFDRYLRVGGLYTYYDSSISTEPYFKGINEDSLQYSDPLKDPPGVRDLVVLSRGPDKGKTGIVVGIYPDGKNNCVVKLDAYKGIREIRVLPRSWVAKRIGEQAPDDVFLIPRKGE